MPMSNNKNKAGNQEKEQNVFSGNEENRSPFKDDEQSSGSSQEGEKLDKDVYRSRNLEIEKERD